MDSVCAWNSPYYRAVREANYPVNPLSAQVDEGREAYEHDIAFSWWSLPLYSQILLSNGERYQLLFAGHPGSSSGPDVRDAILHRYPTRLYDQQSAQKGKLVGDIEFHIRASDWQAHGHQSDSRYNNVILHVVMRCDDPQATRRQDGVCVPLCSIYDFPLLPSVTEAVLNRHHWPCQQIMAYLSERECHAILRQAGLLRFEQKTHAFVEQLHAVDYCSAAPHSYDSCLLPALAEALAYGRDRAFFRAAGLFFLGISKSLPEPLGRCEFPAPLDAYRLQILAQLMKIGAWQKLHQILAEKTWEREDVLSRLRMCFMEAGLSQARTDILIINVALPFAHAVALLEQDCQLAERAQDLYLSHSGLPSNRITRLMSRQLVLAKEPRGSCQQQGLQYIYQQTCREKCCSTCIVGKRDI